MGEFGTLFIGSFEVVREFSGSPGLGEIIDIKDINPRNAEALVAQRYLRPLQAKGTGALTLEGEREHWRGELARYELAGPDRAPKGSELARLVSEAAATEKTAVAAEKRHAALAAQLATAVAVRDGADERADFAAVATALAAIHVVGRVAADAEREATGARRAADAAAATLAATWQGVEDARAVILRAIAGDLLDKSGTRWLGAWQTVRRALDVREQAAA